MATDREILEALTFLWGLATNRSEDPPYSKWTYKSENLLQANEFLALLTNESNLRITTSQQNDLLSISLIPEAAKGWFKTVPDFFKKTRLIAKSQVEEVPESELFIEEFGSDAIKNNQIATGAKNYILWVNLLVKLSDHYEYEKIHHHPKFVFISEDEKNKKIRKTTLILKPKTDDLDFLLSVTKPILDGECLRALDIHAFERRSVMRLSLIEEVRNADNEEYFLTTLISNPTCFYETYNGNYEAYIRKFSLDKLVQEVEREKLDALEKINSQIQEHQTKSLAIPGILIGTALVKDWTLSSAILAILAIIITSIIFIISNKNRRESILEIADRTKHIITIISNEKIEDTNLDKSNARLLILNTQKAIFIKKTFALKTLKIINHLTILATTAWCVYLINALNPELLPIVNKYKLVYIASITPALYEAFYIINFTLLLFRDHTKEE